MWLCLGALYVIRFVLRICRSVTYDQSIVCCYLASSSMSDWLAMLMFRFSALAICADGHLPVQKRRSNLQGCSSVAGGRLPVPAKSATQDASPPCPNIKPFGHCLRTISIKQQHRPQISSHNLRMHLRSKLPIPFSASHCAFGAMVQSNEVYPPRWIS